MNFELYSAFAVKMTSRKMSALAVYRQMDTLSNEEADPGEEVRISSITTSSTCSSTVRPKRYRLNKKIFA